MAAESKIEWTQRTWNPVAGCSLVSPGCTNCYAMKQAARLAVMLRPGNHYEGLTKKVKGVPVWTGRVSTAPDQTLLEPLRRKIPTTYFVNSMSDLFHESLPDEAIDRVFAVMALTPHHTFQVLTKRSARMREYFAETWQPAPAREIRLRSETLSIPAEQHGDDRWSRIAEAMDWIELPKPDDRFWTKAGELIGRPVWPRRPLPNVWLGISAEDQARADERIPDLLATPAAVRFVSAEPLLGPIQFRGCSDDRKRQWNCLTGETGTMHPDGPDFDQGPKLDWIIAGGESGKTARPLGGVFFPSFGARPTFISSCGFGGVASSRFTILTVAGSS